MNDTASGSVSRQVRPRAAHPPTSSLFDGDFDLPSQLVVGSGGSLVVHGFLARARRCLLEFPRDRLAHRGFDTLQQLLEARRVERVEVLAMLDTVPDLRPTIATATEEELAEIFRTFDVEIAYDKDRQVLNLAATITPELVPDLASENDRPEGRSWDNEVAGVRYGPISDRPVLVEVAVERRL
jgi:hypothetical protein